MASQEFVESRHGALGATIDVRITHIVVMVSEVIGRLDMRRVLPVKRQFLLLP